MCFSETCRNTLALKCRVLGNRRCLASFSLVETTFHSLLWVDSGVIFFLVIELLGSTFHLVGGGATLLLLVVGLRGRRWSKSFAVLGLINEVSSALRVFTQYQFISHLRSFCSLMSSATTFFDSRVLKGHSRVIEECGTTHYYLISVKTEILISFIFIIIR